MPKGIFWLGLFSLGSLVFISSCPAIPKTMPSYAVPKTTPKIPSSQQIKDLVNSDTSYLLQRHQNSDRLAQRIGTLPRSQQILEIRALPQNVYVDLPIFWQLQDNPTTLLEALYFFGEPLNFYQLNALEKNFSHSGNGQLMIAALLYRYKRPLGYIFVAKLLKTQMKYPALIVLALNHDERSIDAIIEALNTTEADGNIIMALKDWKNQRIAAVLYSLYQKDPENGLLAMDLANQDAKDALPLMRRALLRMNDSDPQKSYVKCAISKLNSNDANKDTKRTHTEAYDLHTDQFDMRPSLIFGSGYTRNSADRLELEKIIHNYLSLPSTVTSLSDKQTGRERQEALAVAAAKALPELETVSDDARDLLAELLQRLNQQKYLGIEKNTVALAIVKIHGNLKPVRQNYSDAWISKHTIVQSLHLRPIPDSLLLDDRIIYINMSSPRMAP